MRVTGRRVGDWLGFNCGDKVYREQSFNFSSCRTEFVSSCKFFAQYLHQSNHVRVLEHAFNTLCVEVGERCFVKKLD